MKLMRCFQIKIKEQDMTSSVMQELTLILAAVQQGEAHFKVILILVMIFSQNEQLVLWRMRLKHKVTAAFGAHRRKGA